MDYAKTQSVPFSPEKIEDTNAKSRSLPLFLSRVLSSLYPLLPTHTNKEHLFRGEKVFSDRREMEKDHSTEKKLSWACYLK